MIPLLKLVQLPLGRVGVEIGRVALRFPWNPFLEKSSSLPASLLSHIRLVILGGGCAGPPAPGGRNQWPGPLEGCRREDTGLTRHGEDEGTLCDLEACSGAESC